MLYVLGDSHASFFGGEEHMCAVKLFKGGSTSLNLIPFIKKYHIGPATAFNLFRRDSQVQALEKTEEILNRNLIPRRSLILLFFWRN